MIGNHFPDQNLIVNCSRCNLEIFKIVTPQPHGVQKASLRRRNCKNKATFIDVPKAYGVVTASYSNGKTPLQLILRSSILLQEANIHNPVAQPRRRGNQLQIRGQHSSAPLASSPSEPHGQAEQLHSPLTVHGDDVIERRRRRGRSAGEIGAAEDDPVHADPPEDVERPHHGPGRQVEQRHLRAGTGEEERERGGRREVEEAESGDFPEVLPALNPPSAPPRLLKLVLLVLLVLVLYGVRHLRCEMRSSGSCRGARRSCSRSCWCARAS